MRFTFVPDWPHFIPEPLRAWMLDVLMRVAILNGVSVSPEGFVVLSVLFFFLALLVMLLIGRVRSRSCDELIPSR